MNLNICEVLPSIVVTILIDAQTFLSPLPDFFFFFFLSLMIPFLPFNPLYLPNVTCGPSFTQLAFPPTYLLAPVTPGRRVGLSINSTMLYVSYDYGDVL